MEGLTHTLMERVNNLVHARDAPPEWGNPLLSTTPTSLAIRELAVRTEALEKAMRKSPSKFRSSRRLSLRRA